jgi:quaternary ammonium compound-resistance protein SugE
MTQTWMMLLLAGLFEVGMTTFLKLSDGLTRPPYRFFFFLCAVISFVLLSRATITSAAGTIPMGTAYAVWTGIGAAGTALIGMIFFRETVSLPRILLLIGLVACVAGLRFLEHSHPLKP